jgi:hypothetical protein
MMYGMHVVCRCLAAQLIFVVHVRCPRLICMLPPAGLVCSCWFVC